MDDMQRAICDAFRLKPDIVDDRQKLKSALADIIPTEKLMQNVILDAYDEDVVSKFTAKNSEIAMQALKLSRDLADGYGLTDASATWSVSTWCYMLGHNEVAELLSGKVCSSGGSHSRGSGTSVNGGVAVNKEYEFNSMYKAGADFPIGNLQIVAKGKINKGYKFHVYVGKSPNKLGRGNSVVDFTGRTYLDVKENEYLLISCVCDVDFGYDILTSN